MASRCSAHGPLTLGGAFLATGLLWASPALADHVIGAACSPQGGAGARYADANNEFCNGSMWQYPAYQFGSTAASCNGTNAGIVQYTGGVLEFCTGSGWVTLETSGSNPLSSLTAATTTNSIDSGLWAQTWNWGTLSTQTALTLTSSSETTGTVLNVSSSSAASSGYAGYFSQSGTGAASALYATETGTNNTGYAGYFNNTSTTGWGLYVNGAAPSYFAGNVGIGTTLPTDKLDVNGAIGLTTTTTTLPANGMYLSTTAANTLSFAVNSANALNITPTGVGIGVASQEPNGLPLYPLEVAGTASLAAVTIESWGNIQIRGGVLGFRSSSGESTTEMATIGINRTNSPAGGDSQLIFSNQKNGTLSTSLLIDTSGNVGIGTTSPAGQLDVESSGTYAGYFNDTATTAAYGVYSAAASTTTGAAIYGKITGTANAGYAGYFSNTATSGTNYGVYALNLSTSGYGVYASNSGSSGYGVYASNTNSNGVALWCSSSYPAGCGGNEAWYNSSDFRLKDAVTDLPTSRGLNSILKLRPVTFHWKDKERDQSQHIGLIAQDVEPLYPELVASGPDGMKTMSYADLVVPLIKAVQEQQAQINALRAEVAALKARPAHSGQSE